MRPYVYIVLCLLFAACSRQPEITLPVSKCAPMPDGGRASACVCALDGKAYVFAGRDSDGTYLNDLWQYDSQTDTWTNLGAAPMKARVNATMATDGEHIFAGLGYSDKKAYHDTAYLSDWWVYKPATREWKRMKDYPNKRTVAVVSFASDGYIYALYGFGATGFTRDICCYNIAEDRWEQWADNADRATYNSGGCGAWLNGTYYFGTGYNTHNLTHWYAVTIDSDHWCRCASIPGKGREFGACAASDKYVYLFGGRFFAGEMTGGEVFDTYMRYAPDRDQWEWCGQMPCGKAENLVAFRIGHKVYFGLGEDEKGKVINQLYCVEE